MNTKEKKYGKFADGSIYFTQRLKELGLVTKYTGYFYLIKILDILVNENINVKSFSRQIYPIVADVFNKSVCTVERDMRILIKNCWSKDMANKLKFKSENLPTCCRFIKFVSRYMLENIS